MLENVKLPDVPASWPGLYRWQIQYKYSHPHIVLQRYVEPRLFRAARWQNVDEELTFPQILGWPSVAKEAEKVILRVASKIDADAIDGNTAMANRS